MKPDRLESSAATDEGPLSGVRVIEVAIWGFVPSGGAILAEWGADVIKVEHPQGFDPQRGIDQTGLVPRNPDMNLMWEVINRGKRGIALDLASQDGRAALAALVKEADVFLTNFLPSAREKLKIDVTDIRRDNPAIIYAQGSGHGSVGPERDLGGYDAVSFWARSGAAHCATRPGSALAVELPSVGFGDFSGGMALAGGIAAALADRERTGRARTVDVSLLSTALWILGPHVAADTEQPARPDRNETPEPLVNVYRTLDDRFLYLTMLGSDRYWSSLCNVIDRPDLADDERFSSANARTLHARACIQELDKTFASKTYADWTEILDGFIGPWHGVVTPLEARQDMQVIAGEFVLNVTSDDHRPYQVSGSPARFDLKTPVVTRAPRPGEHTREVLQEAGIDRELINALTADTEAAD